MDKNVLVDQSSTNSIATTTIPSPSCFSSNLKGKTTSNSSTQKITNALSSSRQKNDNIGDSETSIPLSVASSNRETMLSTSSSNSKIKSEVDQLDDLVNDLLSEVHRPLPSMNQRHSSDRQCSTNENFRMKNSKKFENRNSSEKVQSKFGASIDEQLIDSLLESVENTLKRRARQSSTGRDFYPARRAQSSSSGQNDSVHRIDAGRIRFPIKINRTESPQSTISSHRETNFPQRPTQNFRATSEPPPDGPIELRRMELIRSPSRPFLDATSADYFFHQRPPFGYAIPAQHFYDHRGYETDAGPFLGPVGNRFYPGRFHRIQTRFQPNYAMRAEGYETDSGLLAPGRIRTGRRSPTGSSRMAPIPETYMVNNRIFSSSNFNRPFYRKENCSTPMDNDSTSNRAYFQKFYPQPVPIEREDFNQNQIIQKNHRSEPFYQNTSIPIVTQQTSQENVVEIEVPIDNALKIEKSEISDGKKIENSTIDRQSSRNEGPLQAHNVSRFWYKEKLSRDEAIQILKTKAAGSFLVRDSQGFPGSFGLAVKVDKLPANIQPKAGADPEAELVRHYLIERTPTGHVRLKGCPNEPDFLNLSELVYHHTTASLALPIKLVLPQFDITENSQPKNNEAKKNSIKALLEKGAACDVVYLNFVDVESVSGQEAINQALNKTFQQVENLQPTIVNFKVSTSGITLTDKKKKIFSRRHFPKERIIYCGGDNEPNRWWTHQFNDLEMLAQSKCFGFLSRKHSDQRSSEEEFECHVFAELDPNQPANAIVNFVAKVMIDNVFA